METAISHYNRTDDLQRKIMYVAIAIIGLMVLFPPKVVVKKNPILNATETTSAGYTFILSDPAGEQKAAAKILLGDEVDKFITGGVEWGKLLIQMLIVGGAAFGATKFLVKP